jgi:hypothetical protein
LPEDNRIIKAIVHHGGLHHVTKWLNAIAADAVHPIAREMLAGACRAALIAKLDAATGNVKGRRPLGIVEKWRGLFWACASKVGRKAFEYHFTHPLPEDIAAHEQRIANAEARLLSARLEADAATNACSTRPAAALAAAADAAQRALDAAKRPLRFMTNWCFSSRGTETVSTLVRGWGERHPDRGIISDDATAMYQFVSRAAGFDFLR